mmetsp:Transcript_16530/g.46967  ORF Transcript_16530/g.46967 Transcript_16530/m.46967 type:complete len:246 (-) Transcript_16530:25-762(-)
MGGPARRCTSSSTTVVPAAPLAPTASTSRPTPRRAAPPHARRRRVAARRPLRWPRAGRRRAWPRSWTVCTRSPCRRLAGPARPPRRRRRRTRRRWRRRRPKRTRRRRRHSRSSPCCPWRARRTHWTPALAWRRARRRSLRNRPRCSPRQASLAWLPRRSWVGLPTAVWALLTTSTRRGPSRSPWRSDRALPRPSGEHRYQPGADGSQGPRWFIMESSGRSPLMSMRASCLCSVSHCPLPDRQRRP